MIQAGLFATAARPGPIARATTERNRVLAYLTKQAGVTFRARATVHIVEVLARYPQTGCSGEFLTAACRADGIVPPNGMDDRAFGTVLGMLSKTGAIEKAGACQRVKGKLTAGGVLWRLAR